MTQEEIQQKLKSYRQQIKNLNRQIKHIELNIKHLQLDCKHPNMTQRGYAFSGDYWRECLDCGLVK